MEIKKILMTKGGKKYFIKDTDKDMHTQYGFVSSKDINNAKDGDILKTNTDKKMIIFEPRFIDIYQKIKRGAQIIPLKDIGTIISNVGLCPDWKIVDAGSGSGALSCMLANLVPKGKVYTYDVREDHIKIVKKNIEKFGLKNISCELGDVYKNIPKKNIDLITFDLPEPWLALENASQSLKIGGFLVSYSPTIPQVADFVNNLTKEFVHIKTIEIIEREWEVMGRKVRPKTAAVGHSGFLSIVRRI